MKKNFFKKLSFVLALAMIVSVLAPAAGAFAAAKAPKLNGTKKYLHLSGEPGTNEFDFNISNKQKGWKYDWSSANENVAEVNSKNGVVTATGVGTTKVSVVIYDKDGEEYATLKATVVVRDNIKTVKITNAPEGALKVNEARDLNRSFVTLNNSTKKTSSVTRWSVKEAGATINDSGVFTATEAGKYTVTARSFQSTAKYDAWKALKDEAATLNVLASDTVEITVAASVVDTKQISTSKFSVEFDTDMSKSDFATKAVVAQVINGKNVVTGAEKIKKVTYDTTGKTATVEMFANFTAKAEYVFNYGELTGGFKAADTSLAEVVKIKFDNFETNVVTGVGVDMETKIVGLNKDGVEIVPGTQLSSYLTYKYEGDMAKGYVAGKMAYIYAEGYSANITATYKNYIYNTETKTHDVVESSATATATGVKPDTDLNAGTIQYALGASAPGKDSTAWSGSVKIAAKESSLIWSRFKKNDPNADSKLTDYVAGEGRFSYTPSNTDLLLVSGQSIYAIAPGTVTVIVKDTTKDNVVVGTFEVVILAARTFESATANVSSVTVGNNSGNGETATIKLTAKDSMGDSFIPTVKSVDYLSKPVDANTGLVVIDYTGTNSDDKYREFKVTAKGAKAGAYNLKLKVGGFAGDANAEKEIYVAVIVVEANTAATTGVSVWKVELSNNSVDLKNVDKKTEVTIDVYGYNSANVRVAKLTTSQYTVTVKKGDKTVSTDNTKFTILDLVGDVVTVPTDAGEGTYIVTANVVGTAIPGRVDGAYINATSLSVVDTTTKTVKVDTLVVSGAALDVAVKEAFTFNYNGTNVEDMTTAGQDTMALTKIKYSKGASAIKDDATTIASGESVFISEVEWTKTDKDNNNKIVYKFTVNTTIKGR